MRESLLNRLLPIPLELFLTLVPILLIGASLHHIGVWVAVVLRPSIVAAYFPSAINDWKHANISVLEMFIKLGVGTIAMSVFVYIFWNR